MNLLIPAHLIGRQGQGEKRPYGDGNNQESHFNPFSKILPEENQHGGNSKGAPEEAQPVPVDGRDCDCLKT